MLVTEWVVKKTIRKTEFCRGRELDVLFFQFPFLHYYIGFVSIYADGSVTFRSGFLRFLCDVKPGGRGSLGGCATRFAARLMRLFLSMVESAAVL